jgi:hypothetical protein
MMKTSRSKRRKIMSKMKSERNEGNTLERDENSEVTVEFPVEAEVIAAPFYTFKIKALPDTKHVEVSFNGEAWEPCREALGNWWFDWNGYKAGDYEVRARVMNEKGGTEMSPWRHFLVIASETQQ